jgi:exodeoxyribonuclease V gamma subunit
VLAGAAIDDCMRAEQARGLLPPGELARRPLSRLKPIVEQIAGAAQSFGAEETGSLDVNLALPDGRRLAGTVSGVCGTTLRIVTYSRVRARVRLRAWVRLLALSAARPSERYESLVIGRARRDSYDAQVTVARIEPPPPELLTEHVAALVDLYDRGMREPLPLSSEASCAYVQYGEDAARGEWTSRYGYDKEDRQPEHVRAYGRVLDFAELTAQPPREDELWDPNERSRFGQYAHRLWDGLLEHERVEDR